MPAEVAVTPYETGDPNDGTVCEASPTVVKTASALR